MTAVTNLTGADNYVLQETISAYADEAYTSAKRLTGTGITVDNDKIDTSTETYVGQVRWFKPLEHIENVASLTDPTPGTTGDEDTDMLKYVKTVRTTGRKKVNMKQVVTQVDGLAKFGRDFAHNRAEGENASLLSVLKGVAISEALNGAAAGSGATGLGGQTFDNNPDDSKYGFYVDLGSAKPVVDASAAVQGAARATGMLNAFGMAYKDYEPPFAYLAISPETLAGFRAANLVDSDKVSEANIDFETIFGGKFRLLLTRANMGFNSAELTKLNTGAGVDIVGTKTSFMILPGSVAFKQLMVPDETEIERDAAAYQGGGTTAVWYRYGYVLAPAGYSWEGSDQAFPSNDAYRGVLTGSTPGALTAAANGLATVAGVWKRKSSSALNLGILPIFHN
jgi:hypothetical protein